MRASTVNALCLLLGACASSVLATRSLQAQTAESRGAITSGSAPQRTADSALRYGPIEFGRSTRSAVEAFLSEPLACVVPPSLQRDKFEVEFCTAASASTTAAPTVVLINGVVRQMRLLLPRGTDAPSALQRLQEIYGPARRTGEGRGRTEGLRYWEFAGSTTPVVLAEIRDRVTGDHRLRLAMSDRHGGWFPGDAPH